MAIKLKGIPYTKFLYLWPPRPQTTIKPMSSHFEAMKNRKRWRGQIKANGQRNGAYINPQVGIELWNRHGDQHRNYNPPVWLIEQLAESVEHTGEWMVLDGELLHCKDKAIKNTLYFWDILVYKGIYLIGMTYEERHALLFDALRPTSDDGTIAKVTDNIWLAMNIEPEQYDECWARTTTSYIEGFVFKDMAAKLAPCVGEKNNSTWQVRCRKPHVGDCYQF